MAQNVISTAILIIAAIVAVVALINSVLPAVYQLSGSASSAAATSGDRMDTEIKIIHACANRSAGHALDVYVKNTGTSAVPAGKLKYADVYFGSDGAGVSRASAGPASPAPRWSYSILDGDGDASWDPGETLGIWLQTDDYDFTDGRQLVRVVLANGVGDGLEYTA